MYTLSAKPRLWLESVHIISAGMWVGGGVAMLVLTLGCRTAEIVACQKRVLRTKTPDPGFQFQFPAIDEALADLVPRIVDNTRAQ